MCLACEEFAICRHAKGCFFEILCSNTDVETKLGFIVWLIDCNNRSALSRNSFLVVRK